MSLDSWNLVLANSFQEVWLEVARVVPKVMVAGIILIIGWLVGSVLGGIVAQIFRALRFDKALESLGADELVHRAGFRLDSGGFIGGLVKWFFIVSFLLASVNILGLTEVSGFLKDVVLTFLPKVFIAAIILLIAAVVADAAQNMVVASAKASGFRSGPFLGTLTRWAITLFALLIAVSQIGIAQLFPQVILTGFVAMVAIAGGIAFGLGGRDAAAEIIDRIREDISAKK